jgi:translation initiation factor 3 subunit D
LAVRRRPDINKINQRGKGPLYDTLDKKKAEPRREKKRIVNKQRYPLVRRREYNPVNREPSVKPQVDWKVVEQFELTQFGKLQTTVPVPEDLAWCGYLQYYDAEYDFVTTKKSKTLQKIEDREFYTVSTTSDPKIEQFATEGVGNVFATDTILAHLMACPRSVFPWDVIIIRVGDMVFFDKRDDSLELDYLTVNETATDPPNSEEKDSINSHDNLSLEATAINQNFSQQILKRSDGKVELEEPHPFWEGSEGADMEPAAVGYRYRKWNLGPNINLVARCELHGKISKKGEDMLMTSYALNEWDTTNTGNESWRKKLDTQRGAVLVNELKNNACKLSKWTAQSLLAGADFMRLGFVSRKLAKDNSQHVILGTLACKPKEFSTQITLSEINMWGIMKMLIEVAQAQPEGKYVLMKDPNKAIVRLYSVPDHTFVDDDVSKEPPKRDDEDEDEE